MQVERKPGRPSLSRQRAAAASRVSPAGHALLTHVSRNNNDQQEEESRSYSQEKFLLYNSLDQFKQTLQEKLSQAVAGHVDHVLPLHVFDNLTPAVTCFRCEIPAHHDTCPSIQLVSETSSRILFLSIHWTRSLPPVVSSLMATSTMVSLLQSSWPALFVLGLVQCRHDIR